MGLKIVDRADQMRPEDRIRVAEWARQEAHKWMCSDIFPEIRDVVDDLVALAERMSDGVGPREEG